MTAYRKLWEKILKNGNTFIKDSVLANLCNSYHTVDHSNCEINIKTFNLMVKSFPRNLWKKDNLIFLISPEMIDVYMNVLKNRSTVSYDMYVPMKHPTPFGILTIPVFDFPEDKLVLATVGGVHVISHEMGKKYEIDRISKESVYGYNISLDSV